MSLLFLSAAVRAQGAIRGRVVGEDGAPLPDVRVQARSSDLTLDRRQSTGAHGQYDLEALPPGHYVVSFERAGLVTVERVVRVASLAATVVDVAMAAAPNARELISVSIEPDPFPGAPAASYATGRTHLDRLPIEGGLFGLLASAPGPLSSGATDTLVLLDGSPVRFLPTGADDPLLTSGSATLAHATVVLGDAPPRLDGFRSAAVSVDTPAGADRIFGEARATLTNASRLSDAVDQGQATGSATDGEELSAGLPLDGRRSWLFGAWRQRADRVVLRPRFSSGAFPGRSVDRFLELKETHALTAHHRLRAEILGGSRRLQDAVPDGAVTVETPSALVNGSLSHRLLSASYDGDLPGGVELTTRLSFERRRTRDDASRADLPAVWDRESGTVAGAFGTCPACRADDRTNWSWSLTAHRALTLWTVPQLLTVGATRERGRVALPAPSGGDGIAIVASRLDLEDGVVSPVLEPNGSSWLVMRGPDAELTRAFDTVFVSDEWRLGSTTWRASLGWNRQRLTDRDIDRPGLGRHGVSPRLHVSWRPRGDRDWTLFGGLARYEAGPETLVDGATAPSGSWYEYRGTPIDTATATHALDAAAAAARALAWVAAAGAHPEFSGSDAPWLALLGRGAMGRAPTLEWTAGTDHRIGDALVVHADVLWRRRRPLRAADAALTGLDATAQSFERPGDVDLGLLTQRYAALTARMRYDFGLQASVGGDYTLSRSWGVAADSPQARAIGAWASPPGDLADDHRHRLSMWGRLDAFESAAHGKLSFTFRETMLSGRPFGVVSWIDAAPWVPAAGTGRLLLPYYFTARDRFRAKANDRFDLSASYTKLIPGTLHTMLEVRLDGLNLFDAPRAVHPEGLVVAQTAFTSPARFRPFDPFSETPREGVNWGIDPRLPAGDALTPASAAFTMPRAYRLSVGISF